MERSYLKVENIITASEKLRKKIFDFLFLILLIF